MTKLMSMKTASSEDSAQPRRLSSLIGVFVYLGILVYFVRVYFGINAGDSSSKIIKSSRFEYVRNRL